MYPVHISANREYVEMFNLTFLLVQFYILCCDNIVFTIVLCLGTKTTWLGFGKEDVLIRISGFVATNTATVIYMAKNHNPIASVVFTICTVNDILFRNSSFYKL